MSERLFNLERIPALSALSALFVTGILLASFIRIPFFVLFGLCVLFWVLCLVFLKRAKPYIFFLLALSLTLGSLHLKNYTKLSPDNIGLVSEKTENIFLKGTIINDPLITAKKSSFVFRVAELMYAGKRFKSRGNVLVNVFERGDLEYGDELILGGLMHRPYNFQVSGHFFYGDYLKDQNIHNILEVGIKNKVLLLARNKANPLKALAYCLRHKVQKVINLHLSENNAAMLGLMLLGYGGRLSGYIREVFVRTGTAHILAISGLHVGIIAFIVLVLLKAIGIRRNARYFFAIIFLIFYCFLVGARASVVRASLMASVLFIGYILNRQASVINSLSLAALVILGLNPLQVFDIGFQLSFVSVLSIVLVSPWIRRIVLPGSAYFKPKWQSYFFNSLLSSFSAWLGTFAFILYYFNIISPVTILANLIIVPYVGIVIALGLTLSLTGLILPNLAWVFSGANNLALALLFKIAYYLSCLPGAYFYLRP